MNILDLDFYKNLDLEELNGYNLETLALCVAKKFRKEKTQIRIVFPSLYECQLFSKVLQDFIESEYIYYFLFDEVVRVDFMGVSKELHYERLRSLDGLYKDNPGIYIINYVALTRPVIDKNAFLNKTVKLIKGKDYARSFLINSFVELGYRRVSMVEHPGDFSVRGMIVDFYSSIALCPTRLEFDGNELIDIREFDIVKELSFNSLETAEIQVTHELIYDKEDTNDIISRLRTSLTSIKEYDESYLRIKAKIEAMENNEDDYSVPFYHHRYFKEFRSILSYIDLIYLYNEEEIKTKIHNYIAANDEFFNEQRNGKVALEKDGLIIDFSNLGKTAQTLNIHESSNHVIKDIPYTFDSFYSFPILVLSILEDGYKVYIAQSLDKAKTLKEQLFKDGIDYSDYPIEDKSVVFIDMSLSKGFLDEENRIIFLGYKEIYGLNKTSSRFLTRYKDVKTIKHYDELVAGDYVVFDRHGIGKYVGVVDKNGMDMLLVYYRNNAKLYIPLMNFGMLKKYSGREGYVPQLDTLGGATWARRKAKIQSKLTFLTDQLLDISRKRKALQGYSFMGDEEKEKAFANAFPFDLTESQIKSLNEIFFDMSSKQPMDRLLAGDVGFGKTELALRASYRAILASKQVVFLCPTTLLAKQHYEVAIQRFKGFDVKIACFSRLVSKKEQMENIEKIKSGELNLIIGTHRLLSDDIKFKDLGLLIVDEEQRFGVAQKEKIKQVAGLIDILTLSATPIPRTLQMSLLGIRELSRITEPPQNRLPIKTYVTAYSDGLLKEAINLELGRKGQVYYLHNRVQTIYSKAKELQNMFKDARIGIAHGQMSVIDENDVMNEFYDGNIDILVCTTIIETGLDIPNVNTIIIEDAHKYGLAQLYQIKGRVGRSDRLAYAYLFYNANKDMTEDAYKRLKSIKDFTELGSGYKIASQDLNIRGAGDILGAEQAGFMDSIGYATYQELLNEVIKNKNEVENAVTKKNQHEYMLSFNLDCCIPHEYADEQNRIRIYRELLSITDHKEIDKFAIRLRDVYGQYPVEVYNLLCKREIEIYLNSDFVEEFIEGIDYYIINFTTLLFEKGIAIKDIYDIAEPLETCLQVSLKHNCLVLRLRKTSDYLEHLLYITKSFIKNLL